MAAKSKILNSRKDALYLIDEPGAPEALLAGTDMAAMVNAVNAAARTAKLPVVYPSGVICLSSTVDILAPMICAGGSTPNSVNSGQHTHSYSTTFKNIGMNVEYQQIAGDGATRSWALNNTFVKAYDLRVTVDGGYYEAGGSYKFTTGGVSVVYVGLYSVGAADGAVNRLYVFKNGTLQTKTTHYTETSTKSITFVTPLGVNDVIQWAVGYQYIITGGTDGWTYGAAQIPASGTIKFGIPPWGTANIEIKKYKPLLRVDTVNWGYGYTKLGGFAVDGNYLYTSPNTVRDCIGFQCRGAGGMSAIQNYEIFDVNVKDCFIGLDILGYGGLIRNIQTYGCRNVGLLLKLANAVTVEGGWFDSGVAGAWGVRLQPGNAGTMDSEELAQSTVTIGASSGTTKFYGCVFQPANTSSGPDVADGNGVDITEQCNGVEFDSCYWENIVGRDIDDENPYNPSGLTYMLRVGRLDALGRLGVNRDGRQSQRGIQFLTIKNCSFSGGQVNTRDSLGGVISFYNVTNLLLEQVYGGTCKVVYESGCRNVQGTILGPDAYGGASGGAHATTLTYGANVADATGAIGQPSRSYIINPTNEGAVSGTLRGAKQVILHTGISIANNTTYKRNGAQSIAITRAASPAFTVNTGTGVCTTTATMPASWVNDNVVRMVSTTTLPTGLTADTDYYLKVISGNTFQLAPTSTNVTINSYASAGSGTHYIDRTGLPHGMYAIPYGQERLGAADTKAVSFSGWLYLSSDFYTARTKYPSVGIYVNGNIYQQALGFGDGVNGQNYQTFDKWIPFYVWNRVTTQTGGYFGFYISPVAEPNIPGAAAYTVYATDLALCPNPQNMSAQMAGNYSHASEAGMMIGSQVIVSANAIPTDASVSWRIGDQVVNSEPASGEYERWVCVVNGVGGTSNQFKQVGLIP